MQKRETNSNKDQLDARIKLEEHFKNTPLPIDDLLCNLGLYTRSSSLVKYLVIDDLYKRILDIPGAIVEFGI